ncbi:Aquaporin-1 [Coniosporium apollinis]|uniref:Aquaporin-1 n=2 Tax=Coniosporium TaxID=2810619 RepID=A0ABQ9NNF7_9PEZI|nr:Aquaporin-1 [Cladosporium sp. JES 115]KAJ9660969.1 Aquaporin-1 [Coniosporium apollinis]
MARQRSGDSILPFFKKQSGQLDGTAEQRPRRNPSFSFVPNWVRNEFIAFAGEFGGTFMFLFLAFSGTSLANAAVPTTDGPNTSNLLYISLSFAFSLMINVWAFFRISGGLFNPAVTLGLFLVGAVKPIRSVVTASAQIIAAIAAAGVVEGLFPTGLNASTSLSNGTSIAQGLFIEMFLTAELVFVIFMLAAEKHKATFLAPIGVGLALFAAELTGVYFTGGSLNPARSFGPAVIKGFVGHHWIYWLGPVLGTLLAFGFYKLMKYSEYETANPGQDLDDQEASMFNPPEDPVSADEVQRPNVAAETAESIVQQVTSISSGSSPQMEQVGSRGSGVSPMGRIERIGS